VAPQGTRHSADRENRLRRAAYGVRRLHTRYQGASIPTVSMPRDHVAEATSVTAVLEVALWIVIAISVISVIREDRRSKRA
jgi:hypothetical protein